MEPNANDVAAVSQMLGEQPAPAAPAPAAPAPVEQPQAPAQQQPTTPVSQPAPSSQPQDPFSAMFQAQPEPTPAPTPAPQPPQQPEPTPTPQPQQPVEPQAQPAPQAPAQPAQPQGEQYQTFEEYMDSVTQGVGDAPAMPDPNKIDPNDEAGIKTFFDDLVNTAVQRASAETKRNNAIVNTERTLWDGAFDKYASLKTNKPLRDMVHSIRMGEFQKGIAITPTQAADRLLAALKAEHQRGVADNQVITTIQDVQPNGGGGQPVQTTQDMENVLTAVQTGGETALAAYLDSQVKAGNL